MIVYSIMKLIMSKMIFGFALFCYLLNLSSYFKFLYKSEHFGLLTHYTY